MLHKALGIAPSVGHCTLVWFVFKSDFNSHL